MKVSELVHLLIVNGDPDQEVTINIFNVPGVGEVYGAFVENVDEEDGNVVIEVSAP